MSRAPVPSPRTASRAGRVARALVLATLGVMAGSVRAELLGTYTHRSGTVHLWTELCRADDPGSGQRARQTVRGRERHGCWGVDRAGNAVVTWSDGSELELDGDKVKLSRWMAELLEERGAAPRPRAPVDVATPGARPRAGAAPSAAAEPPSRDGAAPRDFARPVWCPDARFPHERLVCSDAELAERDLRLSSLWRPYRRTLSRGAEMWHKSDYFRRLKACGGDKACIVGEQEAQMRLYREALPSNG
jgi:hypothetical protein